MSPERETLIRAAWSRKGYDAKLQMHQHQTPAWQLVISETPPLVVTETPIATDAIVETAVFVREENTAGDWCIICEGILLELGRRGYI